MLELFQFALHLLPHRLPQHGELPFSGFAAHVRKTKEVEGLRLAVASLSSIIGGKAAEFDESRFVGMQFQVEAFTSLPEFLMKLLGVAAFLESDHNVVGKTNDGYFTSPGLTSPFVGPEVEHVVQVDVCQ